jgi:hypothetical protein
MVSKPHRALMRRLSCSVTKRGREGGHGSSKAADDSSAIPANMISFFQQFLASMGNKVDAGKAQEQEADDDKAKQPGACQKEKIENEVHMKEIAESSAQGAARGISQNSGP